MQFLTDFADQAVMLPVALAVAVGLAIGGWWRGLAAWLFAIIGVLGTMAVLKYVCFACTTDLAWTGIRSPSGHTAASGAIYGGALVLLLRDRLPWTVLLPLPPAIAGGIAVTRLALHAHDLIEVLIGGAVGLAGVGVLLALAGTQPRFRAWPAGALLLTAMLWFHGSHIVAEGPIHRSPLLTWLPLPASCRS